MRIVFAGTPDYAVPSLKALVGLKPSHEVVAVVTQPDRPRGRTRDPLPPPVKAAALELGVEPDRILQPRSFNEADNMKALADLAPDLLCVVAYGGLLNEEALSLARLFPLNAHGSLLPLYRGAAPIQAAILAGDDETGVSIMRMARKLDSGPVMLQREAVIHPDDTAGTLHDRLSALSATCFLDAIRLIEEDSAVFAEQDESQATYAAKLTKDTGKLDWTQGADYLERFIRAMTPWPGAWSQLSASGGDSGVRMRVARAIRPKGVSTATTGDPGQVQVVDAPRPEDGMAEDCFSVRCGDGERIHVFRVQTAGAREMSVAQFLRGAGRKFREGCALG